MGALSSTSPNQNSAESPPSNELDNKITVDQVPKPRKFFKSRNSASTTEVIAQQNQQQQQIHSPPSINSYQNHVQQESHHPHIHSSSGEEDFPSSFQQHETPKRGKKKLAVKKEKPEKPPKIPKPPKPKPEKKVKVVVKKVVELPEDESENESPRTKSRQIADGARSSGRTRAKCVNYNEEAGEDDFFKRTERRLAPKRALASSTMTSPPAESPTIDESYSAHPPIVLRISKASLTSVTTTTFVFFVFCLSLDCVFPSKTLL